MAFFSGGKKLSAALGKIADKASGSVNVGFLKGATYPDGTSVAQVAFWNEYGTSQNEMRPFFRTMIAVESFAWPDMMAKALKHYNYDGSMVMKLMGVKVSEELQQSIVGWRYPGNAPSTIAQKGFDNPLIDTSHMMNSVGFEVQQ